MEPKRKNVTLASKLQSRFGASLPFLAVALALLFGLTTLLPAPVRFVVLLAWGVMGSWMVGGVFKGTAHRFLFGAITFFSTFGLLLGVVTLLGLLTPISVAVVLIALSSLAIGLHDGAFPRVNFGEKFEFETDAFPYLLITLFGDVWLFFTFLTSWTVEALVSPWQGASLFLFVVFAVTTFSLVLFSYLQPGRTAVALSVLHMFVMLSVAVLVFGVGFGFDPFIHRAAEMALAHEGGIEPRRLLYLGQYAVVGGLNLLTGISVIQIDKWLVPLLSAVAIPIVAFFGLRDGWKISERWVYVSFPLFWLFPFMPFVFTVPFNLGLLLLFLSVFLIPLASSKQKMAVLLLLGLFAVLSHPLSGMPLLFFLFFCAVDSLGRTCWRRGALALGWLASALAIPALFAIHEASRGASPFFVQPRSFHRFLSLFSDPYLPGDRPIPILWELFYDVMRNGPRLIALLALVLAWRHRRTIPVSVRPMLLLVSSLLVSLFLLSGFFSFSDIIGYEQLEFALRLLQTILLLTTPWVIVLFVRACASRTWTFVSTALLGVVLSVFLTATWYLSYPQLNPKVRGAGASVSSADVEVAAFLESRYDGEPYLVLSHQMTSAAALQVAGFRHYLETDEGPALWYPIPTGGTLYGYFLRMSTEGPTPELLEEIRNFANVRHVYFVTYDSWPRAGFVRARAASFAQASYGVEGTKLVVYEYY